MLWCAIVHHCVFCPIARPYVSTTTIHPPCQVRLPDNDACKEILFSYTPRPTSARWQNETGKGKKDIKCRGTQEEREEEEEAAYAGGGTLCIHVHVHRIHRVTWSRGGSFLVVI